MYKSTCITTLKLHYLYCRFPNHRICVSKSMDDVRENLVIYCCWLKIFYKCVNLSKKKKLK